MYDGSGNGTWDGLAAKVVGEIYRDPTGQSWPEALDDIAVSHNGTWAHIHIDNHSFDDMRLSVLNKAADPGVMDRVVQDGDYLNDPRPVLLSELDGQVRACWQLTDPTAFDQSSFVNEFLDRPENDIRWCMGSGKTLASGARALFGVARPRRAGSYAADELQMLQPLVTHIFSALEMHESIRMAQRAAAARSAQFPATSVGVVALDRRARLAFADGLGENFLEQSVGPHLAGQPVRLTSARTQAALEQALSRTDDGPAASIVEGPFLLKFVTLPEMYQPPKGDLAPVRVLIEIRPASIDTTARLSRREEEVAMMLAQGMTLPEIATAKGKSLDTVRTQLKAAMRKAGVRTQAQLVRAMLRPS